MERFHEFVYFYEDESSFLKLIKGLKEKGFPPKYDEKKQKAFLINNSWEQRVKEINNKIIAQQEEDKK